MGSAVGLDAGDFGERRAADSVRVMTILKPLRKVMRITVNPFADLRNRFDRYARCF